MTTTRLTTRDYCNLVLPSKGFYALAEPVWSVKQDRYVFPADFFGSREAIADAVELWHSEQRHTFIAVSSYTEPTRRTAANAAWVKAFWLDIDCKGDDGYSNQKNAVSALAKFCFDTGLPLPLIVSSGYGLHAYWPLEDDLTTEQWKALAGRLQAETDRRKLRVDSTRTADLASLLRPVGSVNLKDEDSPKQVRALNVAGPFSNKLILETLNQFEPPKHQRKAKANQSVNAVFTTQAAFKEYEHDAEKIAAKCQQLALMRDSKGCVPEPHWYSCLGLLSFCRDAEHWAVEWSNGYEGFDEAQTLAKLTQWTDNASGPATCDRFRELNSSGCDGCPHAEKITTPLQLGRIVDAKPLPEEVAAKVGEEIPVPYPFARTEKGIEMLADAETGEHEVVCSYDLYPTALLVDEAKGYRVAEITYNEPRAGWRTFCVRLSAINEDREFAQSCTDAGIIFSGKRQIARTRMYVASYLKELQQRKDSAALPACLGWAPDNSFVIGREKITPAAITPTGVSSVLSPQLTGAFEPEGSRESWVAMTKVLQHSDLRPHAFSLLLGFGAPLLRFSGLEALMVSLHGKTGTGKSTMLRWLSSIYGHPGKLMLKSTDTDNSIFSRLGQMSNLPVVIDELTSMDSHRARSVALRVTDGRDRARLSSDATERQQQRWQTIAVCSTNTSLVSLIGSGKADAGAEFMRVLELSVPPNEVFSDSQRSRRIGAMLTQNHGLVGREYLQQIVKMAPGIPELFQRTQDKLTSRLSFSGEERFWAAGISAAFIGGAVASKLGLIQYQPDICIDWLQDQLASARRSVNELQLNGASVLARFLNEHIGQRLVLIKSSPPATIAPNTDIPRLQITVRIELDDSSRRVFIDQGALRSWMQQVGCDYNAICDELRKSGLLLSSARNIHMGRGTHLYSPRVKAWELDIDHELMQGYSSQLANQATGSGA